MVIWMDLLKGVIINILYCCFLFFIILICVIRIYIQIFYFFIFYFMYNISVMFYFFLYKNIIIFIEYVKNLLICDYFENEDIVYLYVYFIYR